MPNFFKRTLNKIRGRTGKYNVGRENKLANRSIFQSVVEDAETYAMGNEKLMDTHGSSSLTRKNKKRKSRMSRSVSAPAKLGGRGRQRTRKHRRSRKY